MARQKGHIGGFAAQNSGEIQNCYSVVKIKAGGRHAGGFIGNSSGKISHSYCLTALKCLVGGFAASGSKNVGDCFFLHDEKKNSQTLKKLSDADIGKPLTLLKEESAGETLALDTENIWASRGADKKIPFGFIEEKWIFLVSAPETVLHIKTEEELFSWAKKVNEGDEAAQSAFIVLDTDIDLKGKAWTPVGGEWGNGFKGTFDGAGHTIKGFTLKDKSQENQGFFGILKGNVYNLSIDCVLQGGACIGALAAQNDGGTIGCCSAVVDIHGKGQCIGGLVGKNAGEIFKSYAAGNISLAAPFPLWWLLLFLALILLLLLLFLRFRPDDGPGVTIFAPVPYDEDAVPIPDDDTTPNTDGNFVSFQFEESIDVSLATGDCVFNFKNPGNSNHNIVVQLQFTDAQAIRIMGSTGRTAQQQAELEATEGYDPDTYRTVIAESGAVRPGYQLDNLKLVSQANGATIPAGSYNAIVYLVFYDIGTNNRAMLESQLPVVINVQ